MTIKEFLLNEQDENDNKLIDGIIDILLAQESEQEEDIIIYMKDVSKHGCSSGVVGELTYYEDTVKWFEDYKTEINELLSEIENSHGTTMFDLNGFDKSDSLVLGQNNQNLLAWFSFEEVTYRLLEEFESLSEEF
jgi:hypothetical protein